MSAAVLAQHRAAIVALLASVPDIGIVHDRERYAANEAAFRDLYLYRSGTPEAQLRGWWVRRVGLLLVSVSMVMLIASYFTLATPYWNPIMRLTGLWVR